MSDLEALLRDTFAERQHDVGGAVPSMAAARDRARRTRRQRAVVGLGAAAAVVVLAGSTLAVRDRTAAGPAPRIPAASPAGTTGVPPSRAPDRTASPAPVSYVPAPIVSAAGRTAATLDWAPTWLPAGAGERRREVAPGGQTRDYGAGPGSLSVRIVLGPAGCGPAGTAVDVGGRPGRLTRSTTYPRGPEVCVPVAGGGLRVSVAGTADPTRDEIRVAASVRTGRPAAVVVPVSVRVAVTTVAVGADDAGQGPWSGEINTGDTDIGLGGPDPAGLDPNLTVAGRPAHIASSGTKGTFLAVQLTPRLWATLAGDRDRVTAVAAGLQVGPAPDYGWLGR